MIKKNYTHKEIQFYDNIVRKMVIKASEDTEFKTLCLENPEVAFEKFSGTPWPNDLIKLKFSINPAIGAVTLNSSDNQELSEDDLDKISGGLGNAMFILPIVM